MKQLLDQRGFAVYQTDRRIGAVRMGTVHHQCRKPSREAARRDLVVPRSQYARADLGGLAVVAMLTVSILGELAFFGCLIKAWVAR